MHRGEETSLWVPIDGLVPFTNYTVEVNASNTRGSLTSEPAAMVMPPGGKSVNSLGCLDVSKSPLIAVSTVRFPFLLELGAHWYY